jgi:hypothetical protein
MVGMRRRKPKGKLARDVQLCAGCRAPLVGREPATRLPSGELVHRRAACCEKALNRPKAGVS